MMLYLKKYSILILVVILALGILSGCSDKQVNENDMVNDNISLMEKYSLESNSIEIYGLGDPLPIVINDKQDIQKLVNSVDFSSWKYIDPQSGQTYDGIENIFVKFNDSTTVAMYNDTPYGLLGQGSPDDNGALNDSDAYYTFPQEFLDTVLQMIEKYSK